ncbi:MAG: CoA-binding protein [Deltaproteobacteria bacterium]|nr:MAG: CoA-binding protein [Desulfobacterales bacterium]PIE73034.1 MAG: CoA-binding protein [Deltaproteobacteria bacterium]
MSDAGEERARIAEILKESVSVAIVGLSPKESRPSNIVGAYLLEQGFRIYPVNPGQKQIFGLPCYPDLASLPGPVDIVDIFRKPDDVLRLVEQLVAMRWLPKMVWMQKGIVHQEAAALARRHGMFVVMDRCIKIDHEGLL